ncbi:MAG: ABC transporter permease [Turicibacter sp.]|nr:ABC transporter permease [Turicibacter sp.]
MLLENFGIQGSHASVEWQDMGLDEAFAQEMEAFMAEQENLRFGHQSFSSSSADGLMMFLTPLLVVILFSSEFTKKTIYNIVLAHDSRVVIFLSKIIVITFFLFLFHLFFATVITVIATLRYGWGYSSLLIPIMQIFLLIIRMTVYQAMLASFLVLISLFVKSDMLLVLIHFGASLMEALLANFARSASAGFPAGDVVTYLFPTNYALVIFRQGTGMTFVHIIGGLSLVVSLAVFLSTALLVFKNQDLTD